MPKVISPKGRASFPEVFEAKSFEGGEPKFSITLIFPPGADLSALEAEAKRAIEEKWKGKPPKGLRSPFRDAEDRDLDGYEPGGKFIRFSSKERPAVVGPDPRVPITQDSGDLYPGCDCRVSCQAYAYDTPANKGVAFGLFSVQKMGDNDAFGSRADPEAEFSEPIEESVSEMEDDMFG